MLQLSKIFIEELYMTFQPVTVLRKKILLTFVIPSSHTCVFVFKVFFERISKLGV